MLETNKKPTMYKLTQEGRDFLKENIDKLFEKELMFEEDSDHPGAVTVKLTIPCKSPETSFFGTKFPKLFEEVA
jgi:hypothetical protein